MATVKLICPHCKSKLSFATEIKPGSSVDCLLCMQSFIAQPDPATAPTKNDAASTATTPKPGKPAVQEAITSKPAPAPAMPPATPTPATSSSGNKLLIAAVAGGAGLLLLGGLGLVLLIVGLSLFGRSGGQPSKDDAPIASTNKLGTKATDNNTNNPPPDDFNDDDPRQAQEGKNKLLGKGAGGTFKGSPVGLDTKKPLPWGVDQPKIDSTIDKGIEYLKATQNKDGTWLSGHGIGHASIGGLTMLECGVPPQDDAVQRAATYVRTNVKNLYGTYDLGLSILFLDRLGDPKDRVVIQALGMRILAGQLNGGGWHYGCANLSPEDMYQLYAFLQANRLRDPLNPTIGHRRRHADPPEEPYLSDPLAKERARM